MKKLLSLLLCMAMVFALIPVASFNASGYKTLIAENINHVYLSEAYAYDYYCFMPRETGVYNFYSIGEEDTFIHIYDEFDNELCYDDDSGVENNFNCFVNLEQHKVYYIVVSAYYEKYCNFDFYVENVNRHTENYIELGDEARIILSAGDRKEIIKFTPKQDGYYEFYSCGVEDAEYDDPYALIYDSQYNLIDKDNDTGEETNFSLSCYLTGGETYYFEATRLYGLWDMPFMVGVRKTEVVVRTKVINEPENTRYFDGFVEETIDYSGLELELTYSDGTKKNWKYDDGQEIVGTPIDVMLLKDDEGKYFIYVIAGFSDCKIYLDVVENPVESISVYPMPKIELYENISGYKKYGRYPDEWAYIYRYKIPKDTLMQINYTDGSSKIVNFYDKVDGSHFTYYDEQLTKDGKEVNKLWRFGENPITVEYYGKETTIYAQVVENPVEKLTLNTAPTRDYVMWDSEYGGKEGNVYNLHPGDLTGLSFNAHYKDGTTRVFTHEDVESEFSLAGYRYDVDWISITKGGTYKATLRYFEHELTYDVFVYDMIEPKGDIDMDKEISVLDATMIQLYLAGLVELNEAQIFACNVYNDSTTNIADVTHLQRYVAKIITKL